MTAVLDTALTASSPGSTTSSLMARLESALLAVALVGIASRAAACGVSATGVASCSLAEHQESERSRWAVGVAGSYTSTALRFSDSLRTDQTRGAVLGELATMPTPTLALEAGFGVAFGGSLTAPDGVHHFSPGPTAFIGLDWRLVDAPSYFVNFTSALSFSAARSHLGDEASVPYEAFDLRLGGELGFNVAKVLHPYAIARLFGGPVFWRYAGESVTGSDIHHYQIGAGLSITIAGRVGLFVEGIPLGEQSVSGGASVAF